MFSEVCWSKAYPKSRQHPLHSKEVGGCVFKDYMCIACVFMYINMYPSWAKWYYDITIVEWNEIILKASFQVTVRLEVGVV